MLSPPKPNPRPVVATLQLCRARGEQDGSFILHKQHFCLGAQILPTFAWVIVWLCLLVSHARLIWEFRLAQRDGEKLLEDRGMNLSY